MFSILVWIVFGLLAGAVAGWIYPPQTPRNAIQTVALGIAGSVAGGFAGSLLSGGPYQPAGFVLSVLGALVCQFAWIKYVEGKQ